MANGKCVAVVGFCGGLDYYRVAGLALLIAVMILASGFTGYTGSELKYVIARDMRTVTIINMSDRAQEDVVLKAYGLDIRGREVWVSSPIEIGFIGGGQSVVIGIRVPDRTWRALLKVRKGERGE